MGTEPEEGRLALDGVSGEEDGVAVARRFPPVAGAGRTPTMRWREAFPADLLPKNDLGARRER